jgi:hypothetical protein
MEQDGFCEVMQRTHVRTKHIDGGVPLELVNGEMQDISEYLDFGFYDRVRFCLECRAWQTQVGVLVRGVTSDRQSNGLLCHLKHW